LFLFQFLVEDHFANDCFEFLVFLSHALYLVLEVCPLRGCLRIQVRIVFSATKNVFAASGTLMASSLMADIIFARCSWVMNCAILRVLGSPSYPRAAVYSLRGSCHGCARHGRLIGDWGRCNSLVLRDGFTSLHFVGP
jgi:hypothetical protein